MRSMTGCGRCQMMQGGYEVTVELKTVNHRFLDVSCRLPRSLSFLEDVVRKGIAAGMKRGHVDAFLTVRSVENSARTVEVDAALAASYAKAAEAVAAQTLMVNDVTVSKLLRMEGVTTLTEAQMDEDTVTALCREAVAGAVSSINAMRDQEGLAMQADLTAHLDAAAALREKILERAPLVVAEYRERLNRRIADLLSEQVDPARLAQEVAIMADRCAVDEELARLNSHITQMRDYMVRAGEVGKKMDFLIQEMNREANTIGSKASDAAIAQLVVDLKSEIEKLREQIQNVE